MRVIRGAGVRCTGGTSLSLLVTGIRVASRRVASPGAARRFPALPGASTD